MKHRHPFRETAHGPKALRRREHLGPWRDKLHEIIFEADTPIGKTFDIALIVAIVLSVIAVMLESVSGIRASYGDLLRLAEWTFTILFTIEYVLRILSIGRPIRYIVSFFGIVDLLAVIPTYLSILVPGTQFLLVIRLLRILRVFRVLKLVRFVQEGYLLMHALRASRRKITVFLSAVLTLVVILGSLMYLVEGEAHGFTSIPRSIYWAIVTLTTVGYGDISPQTAGGQALASVIMIIGYAILAVPTGIVSAELVKTGVSDDITTVACTACSAEGHAPDASFCKYCGEKL